MILPSQPESEYHAHEAVSRSYLYTAYTKTPYHAKNMLPKASKMMDLGHATHVSILEPELFESKIIKGPEDRRGKKWSEQYDIAVADGCILLTADDYDKCRFMRDSAHRIRGVRWLTDGKPQIEHSAYSIDEATGLPCRVRPDLYHPYHKLMADLKTTRSASQRTWENSIVDYGYHLQEPMYGEVWTKAGGGDVEGFIFILVENEYPHCAALYELKPSAAAEGLAIMRRQLEVEKACRDTGVWPDYGADIKPCDLPAYAYKLTNRHEI